MARMIDIDDVERILWDHHFHDGDGLQALCDVAEILEAVREHPGAVDIVRCKDCRWWDTEDDEGHGYCFCQENMRYVLGDFYCAAGKRREENADGT